MCTVSVIVTAYNARETIRNCVASALNQSMDDLEIVVVDDCSTDDTASVVSSFRDRRVRLLRTSGNLGPGGGRNLAMQAARGAWFAVLDADDRWSTSRLQRMFEALGPLRPDIMCDEVAYVDPRSDAILNTNLRHLGIVCTSPMVVPSTLVLKRELYLAKPLFRSSFMRSHRLEYDPSLRAGEDIILFIRCILAGARMALLPEPHYHYIKELRHSSPSQDAVKFLRAASGLAQETLDDRNGMATLVRQFADRGIADEVIRRLITHRSDSIKEVLAIHRVPRLQFLRSFLRLLRQSIRLRCPRLATWPIIRTARLDSRSTRLEAGQPRL